VHPAHPAHFQLLLVQQALAQMDAGGPLPPVGLDGLPVVAPGPLAAASQRVQDAARDSALPPGAAFVDEEGLLTYAPDPVKVGGRGLLRKLASVVPSCCPCFGRARTQRG
jgi:hypothetical protein